ncbi:MAG: DUF1801 domain-containing protein [Chloroflexota bacterium]
MAELKTKLNNASVDKFLKGVKDEQTRADCYQIIELMQKAAKAEPKMWGTSIIGFGNIHLKYESGRELDWFPIGFSPRKQNLTLYLMGGMESKQELLGKLGKHSTGKGCIYIKKLADVDIKILNKLITASVKKVPTKNS